MAVLLCLGLIAFGLVLPRITYRALFVWHPLERAKRIALTVLAWLLLGEMHRLDGRRRVRALLRTGR